MITRLMRPSLAVSLVLASVTLAGTSGLLTEKEVTGLETNCYLLYDPASREAALIDVGGPVDELLEFIAERQLKVKYFLVTHGHPDHLIGLADLRERFPDARVCMHEADHASMPAVQEWIVEQVGETSEADRAANPELAKLVDFDVDAFLKPELYLGDGDTLKLGKLPIRAFHSPGHSPGSLCYLAGEMLFSGDVLFHRSVGRVDLPNSSPRDLISSVRRLYNELPDSTTVYPGHGESTDIGSEKRENTEITLEKADP